MVSNVPHPIEGTHTSSLGPLVPAFDSLVEGWDGLTCCQSHNCFKLTDLGKELKVGGRGGGREN